MAHLRDDALGEFEVPDYEDLPADLQERIDEETERAGFTPNVFSAMACRPGQFRAFFDYHDALVEESPLERHEIEMLVVVTSGVNDCLYCVVAHGALVRVYAKDPHLADQLATNWRTADLSPRHEAMCAFAEQLTADPGSVSHAEMEALREHFTDEEIWDIVTTVGFYNLSNRLATAFDMRPNEEFYQLGRDQIKD
jgi:uncharacterized peroxidase-related enzyme